MGWFYPQKGFQLIAEMSQHPRRRRNYPQEEDREQPGAVCVSGVGLSSTHPSSLQFRVPESQPNPTNSAGTCRGN